jgi:hypothetical protein
MRISMVSVLVLGLSAFATAQRGAMVLPRSLDEMTSQAQRIVHANVVSAKVEPHPQYPNLSTVLVKVRVRETLKGAAAQEFTYRQFIWDLRDKYDAAGYKKGQELVLFLNKSTDAGLVNPVALDQGRLLVEHDASGKAVVRPKLSNSRFVKGVSAKLAHSGIAMPASVRAAESDNTAAIELGDLKTTIRALVGARGAK